MSPRGALRRFALAGLLAAAGLLCLPLRAQPQALDARLGEAVMAVPADGLSDPQLELTVFKPPGEGPFPVVVPMRQGFAGSGGMEITSRCNVAANGRSQAHSIRRTLDWLATQPWADASRNVVMGQSHGGLATLAYGTQPHPGTRLLVNFAAGLREEFCPNWEQALVSAISAYGAVVRVPPIWFYGDNDSYFPPTVFHPAHRGHVHNGGPAELVAFGPFGNDAHQMFGSRTGLAIWVPRVMAALAAAGLPVDPLSPGDKP